MKNLFALLFLFFLVSCSIDDTMEDIKNTDFISNSEGIYSISFAETSYVISLSSDLISASSCYVYEGEIFEDFTSKTIKSLKELMVEEDASVIEDTPEKLVIAVANGNGATLRKIEGGIRAEVVDGDRKVISFRKTNNEIPSCE